MNHRVHITDRLSTKQTGRSSLVEVSSESLVEGKTWAIAERTPQSVSAAVAGSRTNPLAAQLSQPPRQFLCLTNTCTSPASFFAFSHLFSRLAAD